MSKSVRYLLNSGARRIRSSFVPCLLAGLLLFTGCTAKHYRKSADREVAKVIARKTPAVPNMDPHFTIEQTNQIPIEGLPVVEKVEEFLGSERQTELQARVLSLEKALAMAVRQSREYQNQKEVLYLAGLNLTLDRHRYAPLFTSSGGTTIQNQPADVAKAIDDLTGGQSSLLQRDTTVVQQYNLSGQGGLNASVLLRSGATLASSFTVDFIRFLNGDRRFAVRSALGTTLTQPLLRGFGYKVTMENLTQSERDLLYALRDFTLFRKEFAVRVAQRYYGVLQGRDAARNGYLGYQNANESLTRGRAFAEEGRTSQSELGLLEQSALNAETRWVNAIRTYKQDLDQFKILIGLPTDSRVVLDDQELAEMRIAHPSLSVEEAVKVALATRLDLQTARERAEDAARKVPIAKDALKPRVDMVLSGTVENAPTSNNPLDLDFERARGSAGVNFDLPLDRKQQRNSYRSALIAKERADRALQLQEDQIKLQLFDDWRTLDQAKRNHAISELGVKLAERRVEEQELRAKMGRGTARDLVDAQTTLISSRNERTQALVGHTIARLQFWRDMGILFIKENGQWEDIPNATGGAHGPTG